MTITYINNYLYIKISKTADEKTLNTLNKKIKCIKNMYKINKVLLETTEENKMLISNFIKLNNKDLIINHISSKKVYQKNTT